MAKITVSLMERPDLAFSPPCLCKMSNYRCFRDNCGEKFESQRTWTLHVGKVHGHNPGKTLLAPLISNRQDRKRKRVEQEEVERATKRRELEALQEEILPTDPEVRSPLYRCKSSGLNVGKVPLLERPVDTTLKRSQHTRRLPKRCIDFCA